MDKVVHNNKLVNELGLDSCSCGGAIAWAMECWQRGLLTAEDTGGLVLDWGDQDLINRLIEMIARRRASETYWRSCRAAEIGRGQTTPFPSKGTICLRTIPGLGFAFGIGFATVPWKEITSGLPA
jgi:aldehyde:ferredoxin oxidoreductase